MAITDLRHLANHDYNVVKFIGEKDGKTYSLPEKMTVGMSINFQMDMDDNRDRIDELKPIEKNLEISYLLITRWIKTFYPEITLEWVRENILSESVMTVLVQKATDLFYPKQAETPAPKRRRKSRLS